MGKIIKGVSASLILLFFQSGYSELYGQKEILYAGTFSEQGLFVLEFDREAGTVTEIQRIDDFESPGFQALHPDGEFLYSVSGHSIGDDNGSVAAYKIDPETGMLTFLNIQSAEGRGPCHISIDPHGRFAYVSNYGSGNLSVYPILDDGSLGEAVDVVNHEGSSVHERQGGPHMHSIIPSSDGKFIYASDLGIDKVKIYEVEGETGQLVPAEKPYVENEPGSGPRHFAIHPEGRFAYSVEELSSTVAVFSVDPSTGALEQIQRIEMLPGEFEGSNTAADIHISPDGKSLYASNRGHDSLAIYTIEESSGELKFVGHEPTLGGHPRNFAIDKKGEYVFTANRDNDNIVFFKRDSDTGELTYSGLQASVPRVVCVTQHFLE